MKSEPAERFRGRLTRRLTASHRDSVRRLRVQLVARKRYPAQRSNVSETKTDSSNQKLNRYVLGDNDTKQTNRLSSTATSRWSQNSNWQPPRAHQKRPDQRPLPKSDHPSAESSVGLSTGC